MVLETLYPVLPRAILLIVLLFFCFFSVQPTLLARADGPTAPAPTTAPDLPPLTGEDIPVEEPPSPETDAAPMLETATTTPESEPEPEPETIQPDTSDQNAAQANIEPDPVPASEETENNEKNVASNDENDDRPLMDREGYDHTLPIYENVNPKFAFGFRAAFHRFPVKTGVGNSYQLLGEYLLPAQSFGILSGGVHLGVLPLQDAALTIPVTNSNGIAGFQLRYQLKVFKQQWLVPMIDWEYHFTWLTARAGDTGKMTDYSTGIGYGIWLLLNPFDGTTARDAYQSLGAVRSYLTFEVLPLKIDNPLFELDGNLYMLGIRMEFQ
jgi:hypothetical protein